MTLDQRARQAAEGLQSTVSGHPLLLMNPSPAKPPILARTLSFVGAFAVVIFVGFMALQAGMFAADDDETAETTPTTSTVVTTTTVAATTPTTIAGEVPSVPSEGGSPQPGGPGPVPEPVDLDPPELVITSPLDGDRLKETAVTFAGKTEPGSTVVAGPYQASVADDGSWSIVLMLSEGGNRASFTATDAAGNTAEASIVVYYDPPEVKPKPPAGEWAFTAQAKYGECALDPPFDEYYGTAAPGTKILIISDFGSGSTVANTAGEWWVRVEFPTAPYGKVFVVKAKNESTFEKVAFEFVSLVQ